MIQKKEVTVMTIKYNTEDIPIIINYSKDKSYLIQEIIKREDKTVFFQGGTGTTWTIVVNGKKTGLYQDKHNLKWYVYISINRPKQFQKEKDAIDVNDFGYLN
jgi:hypothetical protein